MAQTHTNGDASALHEGEKAAQMLNDTVFGALINMISPEQKKEYELKAWKMRDTGIGHEGKKIILPSEPTPMSLEAAIERLTRALEQENQIYDVVEWIPGYPFDAAVAFVKAMRDLYGWADAVPTPGFFGPTPPQYITVKTGPEIADTIQVPMGSFKLPNVEKNLTTQIAENENGIPMLAITCKVRKREHNTLRELVARAREIMITDSIYLGKALRVPIGSNGKIQRTLQPEFIPTKHVRPEELILSDDVQAALTTNLHTVIKHTQACKDIGIPIKRGVLLEGKYGTGKSLTAAVTSKICVDNGWAFILLDNVSGLRDALEFAKAYQPAVVFAEDIDRGMEERDEDANDLLNTIDGVVTKDSEVIVVLSTNFVEKINPAMLRPGRLDAVINVAPPDAKAAARLITLYGRGLIKADETLDRIGNAVAGQIPATIREVVERSKLAMVEGGRNMVIEDDLIVAYDGMKRHLELLNKPRDRVLTPAEQLGQSMADIVAESGGGEGTTLSEVQETVSQISEQVEGTDGRVRKVAKMIADSAGQADGPLTEMGKQLAGMNTTLKKVHDKVANGRG